MCVIHGNRENEGSNDAEEAIERSRLRKRKPEKGVGSERSPSVFRLCMFAELSCAYLLNCVTEIRKGIMFQDITTLLLDPKAFKDTIDLFVKGYKSKNISVVAASSISPQFFGEQSVKRKVTVEIAKINIEVSQGLDESYYEREPWTRFAQKKPQKG